MTLVEIAELGRWLAAAGPDWEYLRLKTEELYRATRDGGRKADWTHEHAAEVARYVGLGPSPLEVREGNACPSCVVPHEEPWKGTRTVVHLPDRYIAECTRCGARWVTKVAVRSSR